MHRMTDEEMAEEQVKKWDSILYPELYPVALVKDFIRKAFIAGLEAGRPKWHNVADGDLPESYMSVVNQDGEKVMYDYYCKSWRYDDADEYFCDTPIAWCEIPKFEEIKEK